MTRLEAMVRLLAAATAEDMAVTAAMEVMVEITVPVARGICVAIFGVQIRCVNVWEEICVHACK